MRTSWQRMLCEGMDLGKDEEQLHAYWLMQLTEHFKRIPPSGE